MEHILSPHRRTRVLSIGVAATLSLYTLVLGLAEPLRSLAASATDDVIVTLIVASTISNSCTSPVSMGTITGTGDTGNYDNSRATACTVITNNSTGYSLAWNVTTGTGAAGSRTGTGHLNGFRSISNRIPPYAPGVNTPAIPSVGATEARWMGRLSSTSTTPGGGPTWGADGGSDTWMWVATGSTIEIANRTSQTAIAGDTQRVGFRTIIGASKIVATDTYKASVIFTATTNP